jgi:hypothetical protein
MILASTDEELSLELTVHCMSTRSSLLKSQAKRE